MHYPLKKIILGILVLVLVVVFGVRTAYDDYSAPPEQFPLGVDIEIEEGLTVSEISHTLHEQHIVSSAQFTYLLFLKDFRESFFQAGLYRFTEPLTTHEVITALTQGAYRSPDIKVTFPEGFQAKDIEQYLPEFMEVGSIDVEAYEGYLFPETYFIEKETTFEMLLARMKQLLEVKLAPYSEQIRVSGFTKDEILVLASIIEREAKDAESKKIVSGILQNRLRINMALQVDATLDYLLDKTSAELTIDDLKNQSPFNTYVHTGLPPAPIANPGLDAILAVLEPTPSTYLYYLTGNDGNFYYARTFEEHKQNKARYLR